MTNVLIRNIPPDDLDLIRSAAAARGASLQGFLLDAVTAQAAHLRRQAALARAAERLRDRPGVPETERAAVLEAIDDAHAERTDALSTPHTR